jgi:hypothetical protein
MNTRSYDREVWATIAECLSESGYANAYFRMHLLKLGKIEFKKEMIPGTSIPRILVNRASFAEYLKNHPKGAENGKLQEEISQLKAELAQLKASNNSK